MIATPGPTVLQPSHVTATQHSDPMAHRKTQPVYNRSLGGSIPPIHGGPNWGFDSLSGNGILRTGTQTASPRTTFEWEFSQNFEVVAHPTNTPATKSKTNPSCLPAGGRESERAAKSRATLSSTYHLKWWRHSYTMSHLAHRLSEVAQLVERLAVNQNVGGSNPSLGATHDAVAESG